MTKKDFEAMARIIKQEVSINPGNFEALFAIKMVASGMAAHFQEENPRFDYERFMVACGVR